MTGLAGVEPGAPRMTGSEIARALGRCIDVFPDVRASSPKPLEEQRDKLRGAARAIMQLWSELDAEETITRFAARKAKTLEGAL
ncbi:hypothetical protein [Tanticharoenia sakaeratensis]|uniref:Uncharacterized protein n=1 Tax=Tanticharoenia sakaeratensis NBRC 103193 TaxID=1231623 RepID=A0A0D6MPR6_9PROT|nr:hypothetical protein [Tanticharoenia sakaeratensis]GAN55263.1 hypothetical protein Tasa_041_058 [Tanticharoenia sakaeratensis NBRC 103193]GBQ23384.1 hypothetical protein AA103193_2399 [Tanticharoenia sakaeratensis NBRC 103193]